MYYFDSHAHLQFEAYDTDRDDVFQALAKKNIGGLLVGVDLESSVKAIELASLYPNFYASVGLHPNATSTEKFDEKAFLVLAQSKNVVAIGECGLDNFRPSDPMSTKEKQREVFEKHVHIAIQSDKPLMIHSRPSRGTQDAYQDLIEMLTTYKKEYGEKLRGDIHFFVGGIEEARALLSLDFTLSFTAVVTFTNDYDEVVRFAPLTHLLTETDSPYVAPAPNRGKRNDPRAIPEIVKAIARIRGDEEEVVRLQVLENAKRVFGLC